MCEHWESLCLFGGGHLYTERGTKDRLYDRQVETDANFRARACGGGTRFRHLIWRKKWGFGMVLSGSALRAARRAGVAGVSFARAAGTVKSISDAIKAFKR